MRGQEPWFRQGKTAQHGDTTVTAGGREGRREREAGEATVSSAATLRSGQFTFGCFQSIKALCLDMRVLADLAQSVESKGLCNSLVWNRVWAWLGENTGTH